LDENTTGYQAAVGGMGQGGAGVAGAAGGIGQIAEQNLDDMMEWIEWQVAGYYSITAVLPFASIGLAS